MNHIYHFTQVECLPPYNDHSFDFSDASVGAPTCFNWEKYRNDIKDLDEVPEILKCFTGIVPFTCPELTADVTLESFIGYPFPDKSNTACAYGECEE